MTGNAARSGDIFNTFLLRPFASDLFAIADKNGDGKMTFVEWRDSPVRSTSNGETSASLAEIWAKYDTENVGYLTEDEATNRKA